MDILKKYLPIIIPFVVGIVMGLLLYGLFDKDKVITETRTKTKTVIKYDTVEKIVYINKPEPYKVVEKDTIRIIDTVEVVKDYYSARSYDTILVDNKDFYANARWYNYANKTYGFTLNYKNRTPTKIVKNTTTTIVQPKNSIYIGLKAAMYEISPQISLVRGNGTEIGVGYNLLKLLDDDPNIYGINLEFKKRLWQSKRLKK